MWAKLSQQSRRSRSVEASSSCQPLHRLAGHAGDGVEVAVVMEQRRVVHFGHRSDQEIDRSWAAVLAPFRERRLNTRRGTFAAIVKTQMPNLCEV